MHKLLILALLATLSAASPLASPQKGRIVDGRPARVGEFPFVAAIYATATTQTIFCAGALVETQWILTAGHCIHNATSFTILLGSNTLNGSDPNRLRLATSTSVLHPDYNSTTQQNDIGLIKLRTPVSFTDFVLPIFLPVGQQVAQGDLTLVAGWGQVDDATPGPLNQLNVVELTVISNAECQLTYGNQISEKMVCAAGNFNEGTCNGDMGGALIVKDGNAFWHVGTAAFISSNGCESTDPSGFTRTFEYIDWITSVVVSGS